MGGHRSDVVGIVLGAGSSRRLGRPKQTLPLGDSTILGTSLGHAAASALDRVVLVVGHAADEALEGVETGRCEIAFNAAYGTGCASSLLAGLDAAGQCAAIVLLLGDMPGVRPSVVDAVVTAWRERQPFGAIASYRDALGHPLLFSSAAFDELRGLHGDKAVWKIVDREPPEQIVRVPVDEAVPPDVDTWEEYAEVCRTFGYAPPPGLVPGDR
jgi:molybdenum cofactor cytidylyltransferase